MKKLLFHLLIFTLFAAAAGCSSGKDDDGNPDVRFYAVPASLNFEAGKTTLQLSISTTGHWTIVCDDEWLEAVPAEGTGSAKVGITAQANPLAQQRTSSLTIAYGGAEPAVVPVTQKVSGEESVDLFGSTDEMKAYLKARVEACNYAESVTTTAGGVLKFGFKGAATRGVRKEAIPFFTVNGGGYWAADGVATPVKADAEALRGGASPAVTLTAGGTIAFDGADTGTAAPAGGAVALRCVLDTGKYVCFVFADGEVIRIGSELNGSFNPPLPAGGKSLKILFIGNSFTVDATEHLPGMLKSAGITHVRMVRAYHGGYKLPEFFENYAAPDICTYYYCEPGATKWENEGTLNRSLKSIVESDTWDIVTLQEHTGSYYAWEWDETERGAISGLCDYIQQAQPLDRPTIGYIMAQAYGAYHSHYPKYFANQQAMFEAIVAQVRKITAQTCIDIVIPSGTSLQNLRTSSLNRDNGMDLTRLLPYGLRNQPLRGRRDGVPDARHALHGRQRRGKRLPLFDLQHLDDGLFDAGYRRQRPGGDPGGAGGLPDALCGYGHEQILTGMQNRLRDSELVVMMRGGDKAAFGVLFDRYYDLLHTFARHIVKDSSVAEDIIQNVFVKMWMRKEQVNPELSVRNYLLVATRNELFDYMRLRYNMLRSDINDAMLNVADGDTDIYDYVDVRERVGFIDSVMRSMPDKRREIFAMRYDRNMTNAEIARALNLSIRTVEKHVDLAIKQIRKTISVVTLFFVLFF